MARSPSGISRATSSASPFKCAKSCSAAVSSPQQLDFAITLSTCWCCCQQTVPSNLGTVVLVNRPDQCEAGTPLSPGFSRHNRLTALSTPVPGGDVESCFASISGVFNLRGGDRHDWPSIIGEYLFTHPPTSPVQPLRYGSISNHPVTVCHPVGLLYPGRFGQSRSTSPTSAYSRISCIQQSFISLPGCWSRHPPPCPGARPAPGRSGIHPAWRTKVPPAARGSSHCVPDHRDRSGDPRPPIPSSSDFSSLLTSLLFWLLFSSISYDLPCLFPDRSAREFFNPGHGHQIVTVGWNEDKRHNFTFYNTLFTLDPAWQWDSTTFLRRYNVYIHKFPDFIRLLSNVGLLPDYPANIRSQAIPELSGHHPKPDYPTDIRSRASPGLSDRHPKPGFSLAIRQTSEARLLLHYPATIRSRASPGLFDWYPKPGCPQTIWQLSEVGLLPDYPTTIRSWATTH